MCIAKRGTRIRNGYCRSIDDDWEDSSDTSEPTLLSEAEAAVPSHLTGPTLSLRFVEIVDDDDAEFLTLATIWEFLLSSTASCLARFNTDSFIPAETVSNIARGNSYSVSKSKIATKSPRPVAVERIIYAEKKLRHDALKTVLHELKLLVQKPVTDNVNIAQLLSYGVEEIVPNFTIYLVVDFATGGTLKQYLTNQSDEQSSFLERAHFCYDVASGLTGLHTCGTVEGDLKLDKVLVFEDGDGFVVRLSDFGCAIYDEESAYTGTPIYNAPGRRHGKLTGSRLKADYFASDIFFAWTCDV